MDPDDAVDWTIRNQRVRGPVAWAWLICWAAIWMAGAYIAERLAPVDWRPAAGIGVLIGVLASFVGVIIHVERHPRVQKLKLGEQLFVVPRRRLEPRDVQAFWLSPDPDEDFVELARPVMLCQLTIKPRRGSPVDLVITTGDAARLRRWADRMGILVDDPQGYSATAPR